MGRKYRLRGCMNVKLSELFEAGLPAIVTSFSPRHWRSRGLTKQLPRGGVDQ